MPSDQVAPQRNEGPDGLDHAEGPGPGQEAVGAGQGTAEGEGQDEYPAPPLQGVHAHHEGQGADAVDGDSHRPNLGQRPAGGQARAGTAPRYRLVRGYTGRGSGPGPGGHRHRGAHQRARRAQEGRPALVRASAPSTPRRRPPSASTPRRASTTASAARSRATPSPSCGPWTTSISSTPSASWPTGPASRCTRTRRWGATTSAAPSCSRPWSAPSQWYHERLLRSPDAGRARDYLRSRGYDGDVVRQFRLGWAPDDWDALATSLKLPENVLSDSGLGFVNRRGRVQDFFRARVLFPICDPSGRPIALGGRILPPRAGPAAARPSRGEVQELAGVADLLQASHPLRAQLGQEGRDRTGRGRGVRGLHRRHRHLPGRRALGRRHLRHRAGRGALHLAAQLRQAHRPGLRRRRGRAERHLAGLRVGAQARGRRRGGRPPPGQRSRASWPAPTRPSWPGPSRRRGPSCSSGSTACSRPEI